MAQSFFQVSQDAQIFTLVAIKSTIRSNGKFFNALHNVGEEGVPFENRAIRISANRLHLQRESVTQYDPPFPLGKGRPPSQIKKLHRYNEKETWR